VHREHGVGRYDGLVTLEIQFARHDCLKLGYEGGDKLFVPVENIDVLSRYGAAEEDAVLDRLGGVAWQSRKARLKQRIADMADRLIAIAAERAVQRGETMSPQEGLYEEFCARFPYVETDDQLQAISDVLDDLSSGKPMDRLICGDVGFGKTEVALRAAFVAAMSGKQVAVIGPTTLLARQHIRNFVERFEGCRCGSAGCHASCRPGKPRRPRPASRKARSTSSSERTRCWPRASSSRISAC
jgi:transcription-repair coupling factor (superfamily II helicase)